MPLIAPDRVVVAVEPNPVCLYYLEMLVRANQYRDAAEYSGIPVKNVETMTYVISAALIFYILTIIGIFVLRKKRPDAERPYKAFGYPVIPALYCVGAAIILVVLFVYQTTATWPGLLIVLTGVPVYFIWRSISGGASAANNDQQ